VAPPQIGGHKPRLLIGALRDWLIARAVPDFTFRGLVAELFTEFGVKVDYVQVWRFVYEERLSFKKKRSSSRTITTKNRTSSGAVEKYQNQVFCQCAAAACESAWNKGSDSLLMDVGFMRSQSRAPEGDRASRGLTSGV
jgi:hypothetical protein